MTTLQWSGASKVFAGDRQCLGYLLQKPQTDSRATPGTPQNVMRQLEQHCYVKSCCELLASGPSNGHLGEFICTLLQKTVGLLTFYTPSCRSRRVTRPSPDIQLLPTTCYMQLCLPYKEPWWGTRVYRLGGDKREDPSMHLWGSHQPCQVRAFYVWSVGERNTYTLVNNLLPRL